MQIIKGTLHEITIMQQTFFRTLQGHKIEFNRLLNPISYHISTKDIEMAGNIFSLKKDEKGTWKINETDHLPSWMNAISSDIHRAIIQNESSIAERIY